MDLIITKTPLGMLLKPSSGTMGQANLKTKVVGIFNIFLWTNFDSCVPLYEHTNHSINSGRGHLKTFNLQTESIEILSGVFLFNGRSFLNIEDEIYHKQVDMLG